MTVETGRWLWAWRKGGAMDGASWLPFGLVDTDGPAIDDQPWSAIRSAIYRVAREVYWMDVMLADDSIAVTGSVTSERVKGLIGGLFADVVSTVRNELEVAAPFVSASGSNDFDAMVSASGLPVSSIVRYPAITPKTDAHPGESFSFEVDLLSEVDCTTEGGPVAISNLPMGWTEVRVGVEVFCDAIVFGDAFTGKGTVTVLQDGSSRAAVFQGRIRQDANAGNIFKLKVMFEHEGRHAGAAVKTVSIKPVVGAKSSIGMAAAPVIGGGVRLAMQAERAALTVRIIERDAAGKLTWSLNAVRGGTPFKTSLWSGEIDLKGNTGEFRRHLLQTCPKLRPGRKHKNVLKGIGERIWQVSPTCFKSLYAELRTQLGPNFPIQIVTDEPNVPWEMMHPDAGAGVADPDHLFMTHPIARWFAENEGGMLESLKHGAIASFVPEYNDGSSLPAALLEGKRLVDDFGAVAFEATCEAFAEYLTDPPAEGVVSILHFAGHAAPHRDGNPEANEGLRMTDGWVSSFEVHGGVRLGERDRTFVILNACSAGAADETLGVTGGWPASLAARGFSGIVAPIWAVQDEHASDVVLHQLDGLTNGKTLGEAMRSARVCYREASATPYAYICHGDVMARMR